MAQATERLIDCAPDSPNLDANKADKCGADLVIVPTYVWNTSRS